MTSGTFQIESIELRELRALDLRREAAQLQWTSPGREVGSGDVGDILAGISTQEPFRQYPALAWRLVFFTPDGLSESVTGDVLVSTMSHRVGIAAGADAQWGDLRDECDLTTEAGGDAFAAALNAAVRDWLNDAEAWEARA
jgi:hypothetical protein